MCFRVDLAHVPRAAADIPAKVRRNPLKTAGAAGGAAFVLLGGPQRLLDAVNERPAAQRAAALKDRHSFKAEMDEEARRAMFPHLAQARG